MEDKFRVYLKPITNDDADDVVRWRNRESVKKYFIYQGTFTREGQLKWIENEVNTGNVIQFMIIEKNTDRSVGSVFIRDVNKEHRKGEFGIFIGEDDVHGIGYGSEAAQLILDYAFNEANLHRIYLRALADNERAIASYKKAGFQLEGILKDDVYVRGEFHDVAWMSIINPNELGDNK